MHHPNDIRRAIAARFISRAGSEAAFFVGVWGKAAYALDATPGQLAAIMFTLSCSAILGSVIGGTLVDRYGPRKVIIGAEALFVPAAIAVAFAQDLVTLGILVAAWGFIGTHVQTAGASLAPYLIDDDDELAAMNARLEAAGSAAFVIGPGIGALVARAFGVPWVFVIDAVTSLLAAALFVTIRLRRSPQHREQTGRLLTQVRQGIKATYARRSLRYYVLAGTMSWLGFGAFGALEPLFYRDVVRVGVEAIGYMNSLFGIGILLGATALRRAPRRFICARSLAVTIAGTGLGAILYVGSADLRLIASGSLAWGFIIGILEPLIRTLIQRDAPAGLIGRITGTAQVHRQAGELVPLAFAPALAAAIGVQATLIGGGVLVALIALATLPVASAIDRSVSRIPGRELAVEPLKATDEPVSPIR